MGFNFLFLFIFCVCVCVFWGGVRGCFCFLKGGSRLNRNKHYRNGRNRDNTAKRSFLFACY